jgi:hypothetical protein
MSHKCLVRQRGRFCIGAWPVLHADLETQIVNSRRAGHQHGKDRCDDISPCWENGAVYKKVWDGDVWVWRTAGGQVWDEASQSMAWDKDASAIGGNEMDEE